MAARSDAAVTAPPDRSTGSADQSAIGLDASLAFSTYALWLAMNKFYQARLQALDLTFPQYIVMQTLWEAGSLTVTGIGKRLSLLSGTLSPILQRMAELGLIERVRSSGDERLVNVSLSDYGSALRSHAEAMEAEIRREMGLGPGQRQAMQASLAEIRNSIPLPVGSARR